MLTIEQLILVTVLAAAAVVALLCAGFFLSMRMRPEHRVAAHAINITSSIATAIILAVAVNQLWVARRESDRHVWTARSQHLQRLQLLLRAEAESLDRIAAGVREGRYFTMVANDARQAIWQDEVLTSDVERHFPDYFSEREQLLRRVLEHDHELGRVRGVVSASLQLEDATEPYRASLIPALVNKCAGAASGISLTSLANADTLRGWGGRSSGTVSLEPSIAAHDAIRVYEQYRCSPDLARVCEGLLDGAADLADAASLAADVARRYAEDTVLRGVCTYVPAD